ncbi:glycosyltransferase family 4 protein [Flavobacterium sp.]|uniref:glycosyltransferase family 4 protein n=1 Tax=Flavobacterium sp. TaxID=239 RepID=UPI0025E9F185|nr:glycosyltransferase family 4 protein [Flavobacterium sp.]
MSRFVFFSMNNFEHEGGGTIRMLGIMNELSKRNHEVIFISNTKKFHLFEKNIKHVTINFSLSRKDKRIFQGLLGLLPNFIMCLIYAKLFNKLRQIFKDKFDKETIYFFEYLDNSIGYCLKSINIITNYINDLHGVATLEFKFQAEHAKSLSEKIKFWVKYKISDWLDSKVFNLAEGFIFASQAMQDYFTEQYPNVFQKRNYILPYVLSSVAITEKVDSDLKGELQRKFNCQPNEKIIFFAGAFKKTGGVPDLILAFEKIVNQNNTRLFIVGDGPTMPECVSIVKEKNIADKVVLIGRIPYHQLRTYQDLSDIIVCPDKQNVYSELIVHVKYLDALISGKLVINGSFKSVKEINVDEFLSVDFKPSDVESLSKAIQYSLDNLEMFSQKYANNKEYAKQNLTYASHVSILEKND